MLSKKTPCCDWNININNFKNVKIPHQAARRNVFPHCHALTVEQSDIVTIQLSRAGDGLFGVGTEKKLILHKNGKKKILTRMEPSTPLSDGSLRFSHSPSCRCLSPGIGILRPGRSGSKNFKIAIIQKRI